MLTKKTMLGMGALVVSGLAASTLYAADPGVYVGGQLGVGKTNQAYSTRSDFNGSYSEKDTGLAGRIFAGYQFDPTWSVELGYTKFSAADVKGTSTYPLHDYITHQLLGKYTFTDKTTVRTDALDLVGKATVPVTDKISVYGKLGAAYVLDRYNSTVTVASHAYTKDSHEGKLFPTVGVGASYALTSNVSADVGYDRIQKVGNSTVGSTNLASLGLTYHFE